MTLPTDRTIVRLPIHVKLQTFEEQVRHVEKLREAKSWMLRRTRKSAKIIHLPARLRVVS